GRNRRAPTSSADVRGGPACRWGRARRPCVRVVRVRRGSWESQFRWLWGAFAVSTFGTWLAFDAFPIVAVLALHARPFDVSLLAAAGVAVSAVVAIPLGPWVERRRKRRVMIAMDCVRFVALVSVPAAYALGW